MGAVHDVAVDCDVYVDVVVADVDFVVEYVYNNDEIGAVAVVVVGSVDVAVDADVVVDAAVVDQVDDVALVDDVGLWDCCF